jgi:hypothetical protein
MKTALLLLCLLVSAIAAPPVTVTTPKPPVGVPADAKFFNGKWYRVYIEDAKSWAHAKERAAAVGGQLACDIDADTHTFIAALANNRTLWIGGSRGADALWYWENGAQFTFTAWAPTQPDGTKGENWLVIHEGRWHDNNGKGNVPILGFIAEWPKSRPGKSAAAQ